MKIVYIGAGDGLAETLAERMGQEGNDVYLLSDKDLPRKPEASPCIIFTAVHAREKVLKNSCAPFLRTS